MNAESAVYISVEGETEVDFVKLVLGPYLTDINENLRVVPILIETSKDEYGKKRGGISNYGMVRKELLKLCNQHPGAIITTMYDAYGFPNTIGARNIGQGCDVRCRERAIYDDIDRSNLIPHLMKYEFESLLFAEPDAFERYSGVTDSMKQTLRKFNDEPELINTESSPSHRLVDTFHKHGYDYHKRRIGITIAKDIGILAMMDRCPHFNEWVHRIADECSRFDYSQPT